MLHHGKLEDVLPTLAPDSIDAYVGDPPYGIRFMGQSWDAPDISAKTKNRSEYRSNADVAARAGMNGGHNSVAAEAGKYDRSSQASQAFQQWCEAWGREVYRVLKPGAYFVAFSSTRTYHRLVCGIEDAGFEIRDQLAWIFGSGFPKSLNLEGEWEGWGTALKPGYEPILIARKPLIGTVAANIALHRTGALNIDGCRVAVQDAAYAANCSGDRGHADNRNRAMNFGMTAGSASEIGRWPANVLHDGDPEAVSLFPDAAGQLFDLKGHARQRTSHGIYGDMAPAPDAPAPDAPAPDAPARNDSGSAARFFQCCPFDTEDAEHARFMYCAKASQEDRESGCEGLPARQQDANRKEGNPGGDNPRNRGLKPRRNHHPTVKPTSLMRWLCRLITPPGGTVLDGMMGSGATGRAAVLEGFNFVGVEMTDEYMPIARARIAAAEKQKAVEDEERKHAVVQTEIAL